MTAPKQVERRRASSLISTGIGQRRYSIPQTPESRYYPGGVAAVSFQNPVNSGAANVGLGAGATADAVTAAEIEAAMPTTMEKPVMMASTSTRSALLQQQAATSA